jgi:hypothetical protein
MSPTGPQADCVDKSLNLNGLFFPQISEADRATLQRKSRAGILQFEFPAAHIAGGIPRIVIHSPELRSSSPWSAGLNPAAHCQKRLLQGQRPLNLQSAECPPHCDRFCTPPDVFSCKTRNACDLLPETDNGFSLACLNRGLYNWRQNADGSIDRTSWRRASSG